MIVWHIQRFCHTVMHRFGQECLPFASLQALFSLNLTFSWKRRRESCHLSLQFRDCIDVRARLQVNFVTGCLNDGATDCIQLTRLWSIRFLFPLNCKLLI